jgi:hypothetical protein
MRPYPSQERVGGGVQDVGPKFKPQHHTKERERDREREREKERDRERETRRNGGRKKRDRSYNVSFKFRACELRGEKASREIYIILEVLGSFLEMIFPINGPNSCSVFSPM